MPKKEPKSVLVIHGGAGNLTPETLDRVAEKQYIAYLTDVLQFGIDMLDSGHSSLDTVISVVSKMEDSGLFNAGKGSTKNSSNEVSMDAAIMNGENLKAGSVGCLNSIKNPIHLAKKVLDESPNILLTGLGAEKFAFDKKLDLVSPEYFEESMKFKNDEMWGNVGAIAIDELNNICAATSTGGSIDKIEGRIGDTALIGAGIYASNKVGAVLCSGQGEYFLRTMAAHEVIALMRYKKQNIRKAIHTVLKKQIEGLGGKGGMIGIDDKGRLTIEFNTLGMFRGHIKKGKEPFVKIYLS